MNSGAFVPDALYGSHDVYFFFHPFPTHFNGHAGYLP
jgi:hypothetical protein